MITTILLIVFLIVWGAFIAQKRFKIFTTTTIADVNARGGYREEINFNYKPVVFLIVGLLFIFFQPYGMDKIEAGYQGLKVNLIGDSRGASNIEVVSGLIIYNSYTEEVHEVPLDQRNINYTKTPIVAKGGFACDITPSFNYSVKAGAAADMFTSLRSTYKAGGLEAIEQGWLHNAIIGAVNDVANTFVIDDIFNNRSKFEAAIVVEVNRRVGKWFEISQLKTNITPPSSISASINAKAKAVQDAITSAAQADAARADKERIVALAQADSAKTVIRALAEAKAVQLKEQKLTPLYIEYMKIQKWDGKLPTTTTGNSGSFINIK
jgi:hypothetical protein